MASLSDAERGSIAPHHVSLPPSTDGTVSDPEPYNASLTRYKPRPLSRANTRRANSAITVPSACTTSSTNADQDRGRSISKHSRSKRGYFLFEDELPFRQFITENWKDILTCLTFNVLAFVIHAWFPIVTRHLFPVISPSGNVVWPHIAYPLHREYIPTWLSAIISFVVPFAVMGLVSIFYIGSFADCNAAIMGLSYALSVSTLFQCLIKVFFGGLRPHFLVVCNPVLIQPGTGFHNLFYDITHCAGDEKLIREAQMSFPSGHATAAFAGFTFLALWLNAKFKVFSNRQTSCALLAVFAIPLLIATLISCSKVLDHFHHYHDIVVGAWIGKLFALKAYRMRYTAVFDWRYNHILLPKKGAWKPLGASSEGRSDVQRKLTAINAAGWENKRTKSKDDNQELNDNVLPLK